MDGVTRSNECDDTTGENADASRKDIDAGVENENEKRSRDVQ